MSTPAPGLRRVHGAGLSETAAGRGLAEISKNNPCKAGCSGREPYRSCRRGGTREIPRNNPMQNGALTALALPRCCGKGARNFEKQPHARRNAQAAGLAGAAVGRGSRNFEKQPHAKYIAQAATLFGGRGACRNSGKQPPCKADATRSRRCCGACEYSRPRPGRRGLTMLVLQRPRRGIVAIGQHCCRKASSGVNKRLLPPVPGVQ
jgi:hypothetical protein